LPEDITTLLAQARAWCALQDVTVSDRRWRKLVGLLQVQAASRGATQVDRWDLWLLPYALGARPEQVQALVAWCDDVVGQAVPLDLQWLVRAAKAFEKQLEIESLAQADGEADDTAGKLALARAISGQAGSHDELLVRIVSERARRRYSQRHVDARLAQVREIRQRCDLALVSAQDTAEAALADAHDRLWLPASVLARVEAVHAANIALARSLQQDLLTLEQGFADLPVDAASREPAPEPLEWIR